MSGIFNQCSSTGSGTFFRLINEKMSVEMCIFLDIINLCALSFDRKVTEKAQYLL
jgi:hypothetical protein